LGNEHEHHGALIDMPGMVAYAAVNEDPKVNSLSLLCMRVNDEKTQ